MLSRFSSFNMNLSTWHGDCLLPSDNYPNWLTFSKKGPSVIFEVPQVIGRNLKTMMCIVNYSSPYSIASHCLKNMLVINHTKTTIQLYKQDALASFEDEEWQRLVTYIETGNKMEVVFVFANKITVKNTTVYLIYDETIDKEMGHCLAPDVVSSGDENVCSVRGIFPAVEPTNDFNQREKRRKFK
ncbi:hypothetical protein RJT34_22199 [Clitoria ternatea]|uniref:TMV resistance protein N-like n=1 Tax=Clitoria ternatea TaxID=43366 RepID=A0AAN9IVD1_CLITE